MISNDFTFRYLTDKTRAQLDAHSPEFRANGKRCPVCLGAGSFKYNGEVYECPDDDYGHTALRLATLYWLHNIPIQYQQLVWDEWPLEREDSLDAKAACDQYVDLFERYSVNGVGMTFFSKGLGTGKTWASTATLKRLVKQGVDGWFAPFYEVKSYYEIDDADERTFKIKRVQEAELLVLDEVRKPQTPRQKDFYADKLEELVRPRTDRNMPTIITTNMTPEELEDTFPRVFSLMSSKNILVELSGSDARLGEIIWKRNVESVANGEGLPIT